jgi:hypothetical protein
LRSVTKSLETKAVAEGDNLAGLCGFYVLNA